MTIEILDRKQVGKMDMFTVKMEGVEISDCKLMDGSKGQWVAGPSRKFTAKDGTEKYFTLVKFSNGVQQEIITVLEGGQLPVVDVNADVTTDVDQDIPF